MATIELEPDSWGWERNADYEIRDARDRLVHRGKLEDGLDVAAGIYSLSMVDGWGQLYTEVIELGVGDRHVVHFHEGDDLGAVRRPDVELPYLDGGGRGAGEGAVEADGASPGAGGGGAAEAALPPRAPAPAIRDEPHGGGLMGVEIDDGEILPDGIDWRISAGWGAEAVQTARVHLADRSFTTSLPVDLGGECILRFLARSGELPLVEIVPTLGRDRLASLLGVIRNNTIAAGFSYIEAATDALQHKGADPIGAALGALILYRFGRLQEKADWARNLSNGWPWLTDGRILHAATLFDLDDAALRVEGAQILLAELDHRPMFSETISLMLSLTRDLAREGVPGVDDDTVKHALSSITQRANRVDWSQLLYVTED